MALLSFLPPDSTIRRNWAWDAAAAFFFAFKMAMVYPFISVHAARLGAESWQISLLAAGPFIGFCLGSFWGSLTEGTPQKPWVVRFHLAARLLLIPLGFVTDMLWYLVIVVLHHILHTAPQPAYGGVMQKIYPVEWRGRLMAYVRVAVWAPFLLVNRPAGGLIDEFGPGWVWVAGALMGIFSALSFGQIQEPVDANLKPRVRRSVLGSWGLLGRDRQFAVLQLGFFIFGFGNLMMLPLYPQYYVQALDLANKDVALVTSTGAVVGLLSMLVVGRMIDRTRPLFACVVSAVSYALAPTLLFLGGNLPAAMAAAACVAAGDALGDLGWQNLILRSRSTNTSSYLGLHVSLLGIRGITAPIVSSLLLSCVGFNITFLVAAGVIVLGIFPLLASQRVPFGNDGISLAG